MKNKFTILGDYVEIELQNGLKTLIDLEDLEKVSVMGWYAKYDSHTNGYYVCGGTCGIRLHRLIMDTPSHQVVDHINRDTLDNRKRNLRNTDNAGNMKNLSIRKDNRSGRKGISYETNRRFKVEWYEDGAKKTKSFSINKYGYDEALKLANEFRDIIDDRLNIVSESK